MTAGRLGPYRLEREIGRGGMGVVYVAEDERLARSVALKVFPPELDGDWLREKIEREADLAARLQHPGICAIHDTGVVDGRPYIAMRYVEGEPLASRLLREEPMDRDSALELLEEVVRTIHLAHEVGVVHRDLKPQNIMITPEGTPVILDFGSARDADGPLLEGECGRFSGTPAYAAPEQIDPDRGVPDRRSDVFALGVILYQCLTGQRPFTGSSPQSLFHSVLSSAPPSLRESSKHVSPDLETVVFTALAKEQDARYQTAADLADDLRRIRRGQPVSIRRAGVWKQYRSWLKRRPAVAGGVTALILLLVAGVASSVQLYRQDRRALAATRRFSDYRALPDLVAREAQENWPLRERGVPVMDAWLQEAETLLQRRSTYMNTDEPGALRFLAGLDDLEPIVESVRERRAQAAQLRARTVTRLQADWSRVIEAIADIEANPHYRGLRIVPQEGLVPLGQDPDSQLFEFGHLQSGELAWRDPKIGEVSTTDEGGFVLVLLPGGSFRMGAERPDADHPLGAPNVDPDALENEGPVHEVELDPFFLSKFEASIGQWIRMGGSVPLPESEDERLPSQPIGSLSWEIVVRRLGRVGLALPTEAQMEYATRAGTTSVWWPGDDFSEVQAVEWLLRSPLSVFEGTPNAFGLLNVHGNQPELIQDWCGSYELPVRPGDGLRLVDGGDLHLRRGGGGRREWTRSAYRSLGEWAGFRPARALDPPPER